MSVMALAGCGREWALPIFGDTGCVVDADCLYGICSAGLCDETRCRENDDCRYGLCDANLCNASLCQEDTDCTMGFICSGGGPTEVGVCVPDTGEGPPLDGDPHALRMTDNIENAVQFVAARHPDAFLLKAVGIGLKADGTVDIMNDYSSRWDYAFQDGDGVSEPATYVTITYLMMGGETQGLYEPDAGNVSEGLEVPEATWRAFKDATELVSAFLQEPGCVAPAQESGDSIVYSQTETGPQFVMGNWRGQYYMGNPVTGEITAISCD